MPALQLNRHALVTGVAGLALCAAGLLACSCSVDKSKQQATPSSPGNQTTGNQTSAAAKKPSATPPTQPGQTSMKPIQVDWDAARDIALAPYQEYPPPLTTTRFERMPHYFKFAFSDGFVEALIHRGALVEDRGLAPLGRYLDDIDAIGKKALQAEDMTLLVEYFEALPPAAQQPQPEHFYRAGDMTGLIPSLTYDTDGARFALRYFPKTPSSPGGGSVADASVVHIIQWTLTMTPGQAPTWARAVRSYDKKSHTFSNP